MAVAGYAQADGGPAGGAPGSNVRSNPLATNLSNLGSGAPLAPYPGAPSTNAFGQTPDQQRAMDIPNNPPVNIPGAANGQMPQSPPGTQIDPNLQYVAAFNASLAKQRQSIDSQLAQSLGHLGARRDLAAKQIATMPGQFDKQAAASTANQAQEQAIANKAAGGAGGGQGNVNMPLQASVIQGNRQAGHAETPLLQLGAQANYDVGSAGLNQQAMVGQQSIDQQQQQFALAQLQHSQSVQDQKNQAGDAYNNWVKQQQYTAAHPTSSQSTDPYYQHKVIDQLFQKPPPPETPAQHSASQTSAARGDMAYRWATSMLRGTQPSWSQPGVGTGGRAGNIGSILTALLQHPGGRFIINALNEDKLVSDADVKKYDPTFFTK